MRTAILYPSSLVLHPRSPLYPNGSLNIHDPLDRAGVVPCRCAPNWHLGKYRGKCQLKRILLAIARTLSRSLKSMCSVYVNGRLSTKEYGFVARRCFRFFRIQYLIGLWERKTVNKPQ